MLAKCGASIVVQNSKDIPYLKMRISYEIYFENNCQLKNEIVYNILPIYTIPTLLGAEISRSLPALTRFYSILNSPFPLTYLPPFSHYLCSYYGKNFHSLNNLVFWPFLSTNFVNSSCPVQSILLWNALPLETAGSRWKLYWFIIIINFTDNLFHIFFCCGTRNRLLEMLKCII